MTETIKKYIEFAIENGYTLRIETLWCPEWEPAKIKKIYSRSCIELEAINMKSLVSDRSLIDICTSRPFIDAVARGKWLATTYIVQRQAFAIYNWTLEDFINNLLPKKDLWST